MKLPERSPLSRMTPSLDVMSQAPSFGTFPRWRRNETMHPGLWDTVRGHRGLSHFNSVTSRSHLSELAFASPKHAGSHLSYVPMGPSASDFLMADAFAEHEEDSEGASSKRGCVYNFLENPQYSASAKFFQTTLFTIIILSTLTSAIETTNWGHRQADAIFSLELIFTLFFTLELSLRLLASCQERDWRYFVSWITLVDVLATSPGWVDIYLSVSTGDTTDEVSFKGLAMLRWTRIIRVLRALRMLRLTQVAARSELLLLVFESFHCLRDGAFIFICLIAMSAMSSAAVVYFAEAFSESDTDATPQITSIPMAIWWSITTLTTTGFGDVVPVTSLGRAVGTLTMILGVLVNSICVAIISVAFTDEYFRRMTERKLFLMATEHLSSKPEVYELSKEWRECADSLESYYQKLEHKFVDSSMVESEKEVLRYLITQLRQTTSALNSQAQFVLDRFDLSGGLQSLVAD